MPKYHFVGNDDKTLTAIYNGNGEFVEIFYRSAGRLVLTIKNVGGSIVFIDGNSTSCALNKLHVGELVVRNPHVERLVETGVSPRVDLHEMDLHYANERLEELVRWMDPEYRESLRDYHYSKVDLYFVRPRLRQLAICSDDLQRRIDEHRDLVKALESRDDSRFVYPLVSAIEEEVKTLDRIARIEIEQFLRGLEPKKNRKKTIPSFKVLDIAEELYGKLTEILGFVNKRVDFGRARRYWDMVVEWGPKSSYIYIGLVPGAREHIARHFEGSGIVGSGFFKDFIPEIFPSMDAFLYYAIREAKNTEFHGWAVAVEKEFSKPVGFNSVIALEDLPPQAIVRKGRREQFEVNIVSGIGRKETSKMVIVLSPWEGNEYGVHTIYSGEKLAPMLSDEEYWSRHAFIEPS